jgi:hypothetical protein
VPTAKASSVATISSAIVQGSARMIIGSTRAGYSAIE